MPLQSDAVAPLGRLERTFIDEFIRSRGYEPNDLSALSPDRREQVLKDASVYASGKLMEVEARSHFLDELRDGVE